MSIESQKGTTALSTIWMARLFKKDASNALKRNSFETVGNMYKQTKSNFVKPVVNGLRNGIPLNQEQDIFRLQNFELKPYAKGMHPYHSTNLVDIIPSSYNTNPMAGTGGYEPNLVSMGGYQPLSSALDDPDQITQRVYDERFRSSSSNPLSAHFAANAYLTHQQNHGLETDIHRQYLTTHNDNDSIMKRKIEQGYYQGDSAYKKGAIEAYNERQRPMNAYDLSSTAGKFTDLFTQSLLPTRLGETSKSLLENKNNQIDTSNNYSNQGEINKSIAFQTDGDNVLDETPYSNEEKLEDGWEEYIFDHPPGALGGTNLMTNYDEVLVDNLMERGREREGRRINRSLDENAYVSDLLKSPADTIKTIKNRRSSVETVIN